MTNLIKKIKVTNGVYWVEIPKAELRVLCGCPADSVKHLRKKGLIEWTKKEGVTCQTGPNAILLSDSLIQNGLFSNLSEFPVLQMLYMQGLILPNHPNNTGIKPLLMGARIEVDAQKNYIYRGNYGLISLEELKNSGLSTKQAKEQMRLKLKFAFGKIQPTENFLDTLAIEEQPIEIRNGVTIQRASFNCFEFKYAKETVSVDLNLENNERYAPSYELDFQYLDREYFAVVHSGEGDGWDPDRPAMGSILMFRGRIYLIDAGPNIAYSLKALGIGLNEIEGIFHTHGHDDHFAGLPALLTSNHRIKYYATPQVRAAVTKKMCALMSIRNEKFSQYFETHDLLYDQWNNIDGMEVKPLFSPHPVETSIFLFRTFGGEGYKTYAHLADIVALDVLKNMVTKDKSAPGITQAMYNRVKRNYTAPADLKKIDIGGGLIHGNAIDFKKDLSPRKVLSHTSRPLTPDEHHIGVSIPFGTVDVLMSARYDYLRMRAKQYLDRYFPEVDFSKEEYLLNCPYVIFDPGEEMLTQGDMNAAAYLILTGTVEYSYTDSKRHGLLSAGNLVGDIELIKKIPSMATYRATCKVQTLQFSKDIFLHFMRANYLSKEILSEDKDKAFLRNSQPFDSDEIDGTVLVKIIKDISVRKYEKHVQLIEMGAIHDALYLVKKGTVEILYNEKPIQILGPGDFFGEAPFVFGTANLFDIKTATTTSIYVIPYSTLLGIPIIHWRLLELSEKRLSAFGNFLMENA